MTSTRHASAASIRAPAARLSGARVAFVVDHPQRDLAGIVLTALELCSRGVTCHLVPLNLQESELSALAADLVILNYLRRGNEAPVRALGAAGVRFGMLDTEGGVWTDCNAYSELLWTDPALLAQVACACMWGPKMADHLIESGRLDRGQVAVTGCPRFDFYHPRWRRVLTDAPSGVAPRILINTNYTGTNPRFVSRDENRRQYIERYRWSPERVDEYFRAEEAGIQGVIQLARDLTRDFPQAGVVVRPHPFERTERYRDDLRGVANVTVDNAPTVQEEIFRSTAVIQRSCSTAIECGLAGVPTLSPQWVSTAALIPIAEAVSDPCPSYGDLRVKIAAILAGRYEAPREAGRALEDVTRDWFHRADGLAHRRVAEAVLAALPERRVVDIGRCRRELYRLDGPFDSARDQYGRRARWLLGLSPQWSFLRFRAVGATHWTRGSKAFDLAAVRAVVERITRAGGGDQRPVDVGTARERGDYAAPFAGHSVTLAGRV